MAYVALIGLYFVPILCLLGAGWSYVRWKNRARGRGPVRACPQKLQALPHRHPHRRGGVPGPEIHIPRGLTHKKAPRA